MCGYAYDTYFHENVLFLYVMDMVMDTVMVMFTDMLMEKNLHLVS